MRYRSPNEKAVAKLLNFLNALQQKCDGTDFTEFTTTQLHKSFSVSKSTYSVCKKLGIVKESKEGLEWVKEAPNREMCLQILSVLLEQSKKEVLTPISQDWQALNEALRDISEKITIGITQNKNRLDGFKMPQKQTTIFSEQEQRQKDRVYLAGQIANGIYSGRVCGDLQPHTIAIISNTVLNATDHLLNKLYSK